jgi:hypothetical protein
MNTLEDRLREALAERASISPIDPGAWDKTVTRGRRRLDPGRLHLSITVPAAAAAAIVAIAVTATALTGGHGTNSGTPTAAGPTPASAATPQRPPAPPGRGNFLIQSAPPVTAIVRVRGIGGPKTWTFVWFGYQKSDRAEGIQLCEVTDGGAYYGGGSCGPVSLQAQQGFVAGIGSVRMGTAPRRATSVAATLPTGRTVKGVVVSGNRFPGNLWLVNYPIADTARIVLRDATGQEIAHTVITGEPPALPHPRSGGITVFRYRGTATVAYLIDGRVTFWEGSAGIAPSGPPSQIPLVIFNPLNREAGEPQINFGYAPADVARVALQLSDGREFSTGTIAGWPGSGVRLWGPIIMPPHVLVTGSTMILTYNAAGHLLDKEPLSKVYG